MPMFQLTTRVARKCGVDVGISVVPILEGEGFNGMLVCSVVEGSLAAGKLRVGDRVLQTNGICCVNPNKFMEGVCHQFRINTIDFMVLRYYVAEPSELELEMPKGVEPYVVLEADASVTTAPMDIGLEKHDIVLSVDGAEVKTGEEAKAKMVAAAGPNVKVKVGRGMLPAAAAALVPKRKETCDYFVAHVNPKTQGAKPLGLFVRDVAGLVVVCSAAAGTVSGDHLIALDRILSVNAVPVKTVAECAAAIGKSGGTFWMLVERCLSVPELVHNIKLLNPHLGVKPQWPVPNTAPDITALQSELAKKPKVEASTLRSISKESGVGRKESKEGGPVVAAPPAVSTPSDETLPAAPAEKRGVAFKDAVETTEIYMDVVPKRIKRR